MWVSCLSIVHANLCLIVLNSSLLLWKFSAFQTNGILSECNLNCSVFTSTWSSDIEQSNGLFPTFQQPALHWKVGVLLQRLWPAYHCRRFCSNRRLHFEQWSARFSKNLSQLWSCQDHESKFCRFNQLRCLYTPLTNNSNPIDLC